jgi:hypothetical protein
MLDRGSSARGSKGVRSIVGSYMELQKGTSQSPPTNCRIASPVFQIVEKQVDLGASGRTMSIGRAMSVSGGALTAVWQSLHETTVPVAAFVPDSD